MSNPSANMQDNICSVHSLASPCGKSGNGPEVALISFVEVAGFVGVADVSDSTGIFSSECVTAGATIGTGAAGLTTSGVVVTGAGAAGVLGSTDGETDNGDTFSWSADMDVSLSHSP